MYLLDANVLIWWFTGDKRLGREAQMILGSSTAQLNVSLMTLFEIELKIDAGKLRLPDRVTAFLNRFDVNVHSPTAEELPMVLRVRTEHRDPYDKSLVGLAVLKRWNLLTSDKQLLKLTSLPIKVLDSRE